MVARRLTLPPSANELVRPAFMEDLKCVYCGNRPPKRPLVRLVATGEAKVFRKQAHRCLPIEPVAGPVELYVTVYLPSLASDGLNRIKALEDAINGRLWFDDRQIAEWHIKRVITDDETKHGVVFEVLPADPAEHPELARRLARSTIQEQANELAQSKMFPPTDGGGRPEVQPVKPSDARGAVPNAERPRAVLPEPLQQVFNRLAKPALISHRGPDDEPPEHK